MHKTTKSAQRVVDGVLGLAAKETSIPELAVPVRHLTESAARLRELALTQDVAAGESRKHTSAIQRNATALRVGLLRPVVLAMNTAFPKTGGDHGDTGDHEDIRRRFNQPRVRTDYSQLVVSARSVAQAVEQYRSQFMAAGIPQEYVARIRAAADALEALIYARGVEERNRMNATQALLAETRRGMSLVRLISAMVVPTLQGEPGRAAEWAKVVRKNRPSQPKGEGEGDEGSNITESATTEGTPSSGSGSGGVGIASPTAPARKAA